MYALPMEALKNGVPSFSCYISNGTIYDYGQVWLAVTTATHTSITCGVRGLNSPNPQVGIIDGYPGYYYHIVVIY